MKRIASITTGLASMGVGFIVQAAELPRRDVVVPPPVSAVEVSSAPYHWTSYFFGGSVGVVWGTDRGYSIMMDDGVPSVASFGGNDRRSWEAGAHAGMSHQFDNRVVAGIEADLSGIDPAGRSQAANGHPAQSYNWLSTLRVRTGYAFDRFLPYATAGIALAGSNTLTPDYAGGAFARDRDTLVGFVAGAGIEYAMTEDLSIRGEYIHARFGSSASFTKVTPGDVVQFTGREPRMEMIRIGATYRFR